MSKGFFDELINDLMIHAAVERSRSAKGRPDPYKAVGILFGTKGELSDSDLADLGAYLGAEGAFDDDHDVKFNMKFDEEYDDDDECEDDNDEDDEEDDEEYDDDEDDEEYEYDDD